MQFFISLSTISVSNDKILLQRYRFCSITVLNVQFNTVLKLQVILFNRTLNFIINISNSQASKRIHFFVNF